MPDGGSLVVGSYRGDGAHFGSSTKLTSDEYDFFLARFDHDDTTLWVQGVTAPDDEDSIGVAANAAGRVIIAGEFPGTVAFGDVSITSAGEYDAFLASIVP